MIVQLHRALQNREVDFSAGPNSEEALDLQNIWMFLGMFFIQHLDVKDTPVSEITDKRVESYIIDDINNHWRQKKSGSNTYLMWSDAQRWPMGLAGSVRLG